MAPGLADPPLSPTRLSTSISRSLFPTGPSFTLETFSSRDFIVKDFVELLSDSAVPVNRRSGAATQSSNQNQQAFDPRPLIRTFEQAQNHLKELSEDLEGRETELSGAVRRAEAQHNSTLSSQSKNLKSSLDSFRRLDRQLNGDGYGSEGALQAISIGQKLEELDRQCLRARDAEFLIRCWVEVSEKGHVDSLEELRRKGGGKTKIRCATIARQLLKLSQRLDGESWGNVQPDTPRINGHGVKTSRTNGVNGHVANGEKGGDAVKPKHNTREVVEKFSETLEKDLLAQFDEFYRKANFDGMRECATVLQDFGGGASVIGTFVNQHQFFIDRAQLITDDVVGDPDLWDALADPDADPPGVEPSLQNLVEEVKTTMIDECSIIKQSFPYYELVLARFLQRVFQQSIQQRLEKVLEKANTISTLAFLRSLQCARNCVAALVDDLKAHGLTEHPDVLSSHTVLVLDQQFDDLFVPYAVGSSYIEREKRNLEELYSSLLFKFTVFHSRRKKAPTGYLASLASSGREMLASAREAYVERLDSSDIAPQQKQRMMRLAGLKDNASTRNQAEQEFGEEDGVLSTANAKRMMKWLAEAVGRSLELSGGHETPKDVNALLDLLLLHMGQLYIETALDACVYVEASAEPVH